MTSWQEFTVPIHLPDDPLERAKCEKLLDEIYEENRRWLMELVGLASMESKS